jgi:transposase
MPKGEKLMLYAQIDEERRQTLQAAMKETTDKKWYRRLKIIDLSGRGQGVADLAELFDLSSATVRSYIHQYNEGDLAQLSPGYGVGRPTVLSWTAEAWQEVMGQRPSQLEKLNSGAQNWTQALLLQYLATYHSIKVSQATLSKALRRAGIHWRRAKLKVTSPDPLYTVKRQRLELLQQKAGNGSLSSADATHPPPDQPPKPARLAFFDATDLHWCPDIGPTYGPAGQQAKIESPGNDNPWLALLGSLIFPSGEALFTIHAQKRHLELVEHLQLLIDYDPNVFWFVVLDNASAHTTSKLADFWHQHQGRLEPVFLPSYSPHLNLIERLWRLMRAQVTRNRFFSDLSAQAEAVVDWLTLLPFANFSSLMGITTPSLS